MKKCNDCKKPMRARYGPYIPGTVQEVSPRGDTCRPCAVRACKSKAKSAVTEDQTRANRLALQAYLDRRRPYRQEAGTL